MEQLLRIFAIVLIITCVAAWVFMARKVKKHSPWWELGLGIFIFGVYYCFILLFTKQLLDILLNSSSGFLIESVGWIMVLSFFLLYFVTIATFVVASIAAAISNKNYLFLYITIFTLIGE